jgi:hypothetical protein
MSTMLETVRVPTARSDVAVESQAAAITRELRQRWVAPHVEPPGFRIAEADVDRLAREALDTMLTRQYRVTPMPADDEYADMLGRVRHFVARGKPIRVMIGYGPMKNPNTVPHVHCDWAEFFALCHLCTWHNKVCGVYPPGLRIKIVFDDSTIRMANRHAREPMNAYMSSIAGLIKALGYEPFIVGTMRQGAFSWLFHFGPYQIARRRVRRWEQDPANREALERMTEFAKRNLHLPAGVSEQERQRQSELAANRYRVYWEALQLSGFSRLGHKLIAMYLDGTQHHIRQRAALHLTSVGKGQVTQPWQGEGALLDNGHGKLVPLVLTAGRRDKLLSQVVSGLDMLPLAGFDAIEVCRETRE